MQAKSLVKGHITTRTTWWGSREPCQMLQNAPQNCLTQEMRKLGTHNWQRAPPMGANTQYFLVHLACTRAYHRSPPAEGVGVSRSKADSLSVDGNESAQDIQQGTTTPAPPGYEQKYSVLKRNLK